MDPVTSEQIRQQDGALNAQKDHNDVVRVSVKHPCVVRGMTQVVHVLAPPRAQVTLGIAYSDGGPHGAMAIALSDDGGRYDWQVAIGPDVPPGHATVLVGSSGPDRGDGGGTAHARFVVTEAEGC